MFKELKSIILIVLVLCIVPVVLAYPSITINSPLNQTYNISIIDFNVNISEQGLYCNYSLDSWATNINMSTADGFNFNYTNLSMSDGHYDVIFYCSNLAEEINSANVSFSIDSTNPEITFNLDTDNTTITNKNYIIINVTATDANLNYTEINIYNATGEIVNNTIGTYINYTIPTDGQYFFNATTYDLAGHTNSTETRNITIDTIAPVINITYPSNNTAYKINVSKLNYTLIEIHPDSCWYSNNSGLWNSTSVPAGTDFTNITNMEENNTWIIYCNDTAGNINSSIVNFYKDTIAQSIDIVYPTINGVYNYSISSINYTYYNIHPEYCWYSNNSGIWNSTSVPAGTQFTNVISTEGSNNWKIYCNNTAGDINSSTVNFVIDTTAPSITINTPTSSNHNTTTQWVNITVTDFNLSTIWYNYNGTNITYTNTTEINFSEGNNTLHVWANDTLGNTNYTNITFTIDTIPPTITFNTPISNGLNSNVSNITFNITATDLHINNITFYLYNNTNVLINTTSGNDSIYFNINLVNGTYYYNATAYDNLGNRNNTELRNITINTTAEVVVEEDDDPPSGGGNNNRASTNNNLYSPPFNTPDTNGSVTFTEFLSRLSTGPRNISINRTGIPITLVTLDINKSLNLSSNFKIITQAVNPSGERINATIYKYILFNTTIPQGYLNNITIQFKIEKSWITKNNISTGNITLHIYNENAKHWIITNTSKYNEDNDYAYYAISSQTLNTLALGAPIIKKIEVIVTEKNETPEIIIETNNATVTTDNLVVIKKANIFQKISTSLNNMAQTINANISKETQVLVITILSGMFLIIVGVVSSILLYRKVKETEEMRRFNRINKKIISRGRLMPYTEEPPKEPTPIPIPKIQPIPIEKPKLETSSEQSPEFYVRKVNELLLQCEYALDNGKIAEAKEYYSNARNIYFNSGLDYEEKSRLYNRIIELYGRFNKK